MPLDNAGILEQLDGPIHRRNRNSSVDFRTPPVQFLDIGMIVGIVQHARNGAALLGHAHAFFLAARFDGARQFRAQCPFSKEHDPEKWEPVFRKDHARRESALA